MNHGIEFTWKNLAEASDDAARKFAWIAAGLFLACGVLSWLSVSTHVRYSQTCEYIDQYGPRVAGQQNQEGEFARVLLHSHCG